MKKTFLILMVSALLVFVISGCYGAPTSVNSTVQTNTQSQVLDTTDSKEKSVDDFSFDWGGSDDTEVDDGATLGEKNALKSAKSYLDYSSFSKDGLAEQLEFEGYSDSEVQYAMNHIDADWNEQAVLSAKSYLDYSAFSESGLIQQLEFEGYTSEQAAYGVSKCGADWNEQAAKCAKSYLDYSSFSRSELIQQLEFEGFTSSQAEYGVSTAGY